MIRLDAEKFGSLALVAANPKWVQTIFELAIMQWNLDWEISQLVNSAT